MLKTHWITNSAAAKQYFAVADYYATCPGEWLGKGAKLLGLSGPAAAEDFNKLCDNINPLTGELLRPHAREDGRIGMDLTFNSTKSVGIARELAGPDNAGDKRIELAHREAVAYTMKHVEADVQTRVRIGGADLDRVTGNMVAYRVTHRDTRISADDQMPDMSLHDHVFVLNATYDSVEGKWKAAQMGQVKHDAPYYEAIYHNRLAANLQQLGYGIRREGKAFEINGVSRELIEKFSRRRQYIKAVAEKLGITSAAGRDKLGATTRLGKTKDLADDLNGYYVSRLTEKERKQLAGLIGQPSYQSSAEKAVQFAIGHLFERQSVVDGRRLYETALRHGIGSVTLEEVIEESRRQGVLLKNGEATTKDVLAEEGKVISFAREGKGACSPMAAPDAFSLGKTDHMLSAEQLAMVSHVLTSPDQVTLVIGDAGTGKTRSIKAAFSHIDKPIEMLAPSADASRGVLREEGFSKADTVASFLMSEERQAGVKNGIIWVDEAALLGIKDLSRLVDIVKAQNARIVLQGDPKQHQSVVRGGNMMNVLQEYAGLQVGKLTEIWRQQHKGYKAVVADIAKGDILSGYDKLNDLGWVKHVDSNQPLVDDYLAGLDANRSVLVVAPTHLEGLEITASLRQALKERGMVNKDERLFETLRPLGWTAAEKGDLERYDGTEILQYHRNSGTFRAGQRVRIADWEPGQRLGNPEHLSVYSANTLGLAAGDRIRITANGKTRDGKHRLNNGSLYTVKGFTKEGDIALTNDWVIGKDFRHLAHGYVTTSHAAQGKTVDRVLIAMGSASRPAVSAEQFYVSVSRGKESTKVYTDMPTAELREAIVRTDNRKSATELMQPKPKRPGHDRLRKFLKKVRDRFKLLQTGLVGDTREQTRQKELSYAGIER